MKITARVLAAISLAILAYVVYAHAVAWRRGAEYRTPAVVIGFASDAELRSKFAIEQASGLSFTREGSSLRVRGACEKAGARFAMVGAPTRLGATRARMRVRVRSASPVDVTAGVEHGSDAHELRFGVAASDQPTAELRLLGDAAPTGPKAQGDRILARIDGVPVATGDDAPMRDIGLAIEPDVFMAIATLDGAVLRSVPIVWANAVLVRPVFAVTCRDVAPRVDVEIAEIAWEPILRDTLALDFDDRFTGAVFDPRWRVVRAIPDDVVSMSLAVGASAGPSKGMALTAKAKKVTLPLPILGLYSPRVRAESFHAALTVDIASLRQGSFHLGVANPYAGLSFFRTIDAGVTERDGKLVPFTSGHFSNDGQAAFRLHEKALAELPEARGVVVLELDFDAKARTARAKLNGTTITEEPVALQPFEDVTFHVGVNADGPLAEMAMNVTRVTFQRERR